MKRQARRRDRVRRGAVDQRQQRDALCLGLPQRTRGWIPAQRFGNGGCLLVTSGQTPETLEALLQSLRLVVREGLAKSHQARLACPDGIQLAAQGCAALGFVAQDFDAVYSHIGPSLRLSKMPGQTLAIRQHSKLRQ